MMANEHSLHCGVGHSLRDCSNRSHIFKQHVIISAEKAKQFISMNEYGIIDVFKKKS